MLPGDVMEMLAEGQRNAVANSTKVAMMALANPALVKTLVDALSSPNKTVASHAAHATYTIFRKNPGLLKPFARQLLDIFRREQWEVVQQLAKVLPGLNLAGPQQKTFVARLEQVFYDGTSSFARASALQALNDLGKQHAKWGAASTRALRFALENGSKAMQARARKLLS